MLLPIWRDGKLRNSLYDKYDNFNFHITSFPFMSSNIQFSPAYDFFFISPLNRYARACSFNWYFDLRAMRLFNEHLRHGYVKERLKLSLRKFYSRDGDFIKQCEVPSPECYMTFWMLTIYSVILHRSLTPICDFATELDLITEFDFVSICEHSLKVWHANRGHLL